MALEKNISNFIAQNCKILWIAVATIFATNAVASAQTVVIGGSNQPPISVNMAPTYGAFQRNSPLLAGNADYSKGAKIIDGNEVITLTPPGSQPKKRRVVAKPVKRTPSKTVATKKPEKISSKSIAPMTPESKAVVKTPKVIVADKSADKTQNKIVKAQVPATKKAASEVQPKLTETTAPKMIAATTTEKKPTPIIPKAKPEPAKEPEVKVAAVAPEEMAKPIAPSKPMPVIEPDAPAGLHQLFFEKGETKLPANGKTELKKLASVVSKSNQRIQLVAFADASSNGTARRLSLGRALVIRSELMALGVPNNKIEVRALGKPTDNSPADRVDLKLVAR